MCLCLLLPIVVISVVVSAILSATGHPGGLVSVMHLNGTKITTEEHTTLHPRHALVKSTRTSMHNPAGELTITKTASDIKTVTATFLDFEIGPIEGSVANTKGPTSTVTVITPGQGTVWATRTRDSITRPGPIIPGSLTSSTTITDRTATAYFSSLPAVPNPQPVQGGTSTVPGPGVTVSSWSDRVSFSTFYTQATPMVTVSASSIEPDDLCADSDTATNIFTKTVIKTLESLISITRTISNPPNTRTRSRSASWLAPLTSTSTVTSTTSPGSARETVGQEGDLNSTKLAKRCASPTVILATTSRPTINCTNIEGAWQSWITSWSYGGDAVMSCAMDEKRGLESLVPGIREPAPLAEGDDEDAGDEDTTSRSVDTYCTIFTSYDNEASTATRPLSSTSLSSTVWSTITSTASPTTTPPTVTSWTTVHEPDETVSAST